MIGRPLPSLRPRVLVAAALLLIAPGCAVHKWKARFAPSPGTVERLRLTSDVAVSARLPIVGGPEGRIELLVDSTRRVASRARRGPTRIELTLDRVAFDFDVAGRSARYDSAGAADVADAELVGPYVELLLGRTLAVSVLRSGEVVDVRGVDDLYDALERLPESGSALAPLLDSLTRELGTAALIAVLQQATPVFPGGRLGVGDSWSWEGEFPNPLFETMATRSDYRLEELGVYAGRPAVRTAVELAVRPEGEGPLLAQLAALAGIEGDLRIEDAQASGTSVLWSSRRGGQTLGLVFEQSIRGFLSVPIKVLGFTRRTRIPLEVDQHTRLQLLDAP